MDRAHVEQRFLAGLAGHGLTGLEQSRDVQGCLVVRLSSPCDTVGCMRAWVSADEILLSCELTHSHVEAEEHRRRGAADPAAAMIAEAVDGFADFVQGRTYVLVETGFDGRRVGGGWRRVGGAAEPNPRYRQLVERQHGGPSTFRGWGWHGEIENVGADS